MVDRADRESRDEGRIPDRRASRRAWLEGVILGVLAAPRSRARAQTPAELAPGPGEAEAIAAIRDQAKKVGLNDLEARRTPHFLGVGDGPARYNAQALELCESIGRDYLAHFRRLGFRVDFPPRRLVVVTLKDGSSYRAFSGQEPDEMVGGHYEPDANRLVIFDFRGDAARQTAEAKRYNTFTLVHETLHLLSFNTGLLSRNKDVPPCISEGLATYGELWTPPRDPRAFGGVNRPRLQGLIEEMERGAEWIPIDRLLTDDKLFDDPRTYHLAYGESWALVHYLLETKERPPKFRAYLAEMPELSDVGRMKRDAYAESRLGSVRDLDRAVQVHARAMARRARPPLAAGVIRGRG